MKISLDLIGQLARFLLVGVLNTIVDLGILNVLIWISDSNENTLLYIVFKSFSFVLAVINSYYLNKYWTFHSRTENRSEFIVFFIVSTVGFFLNVLVSTIVFSILTTA